MTPDRAEPTIGQLREEMELLRGELDQVTAQLDRVDARTNIHGQVIDDIEATAKLASRAAEQTRATAEQATLGDAPAAEQAAGGPANGSTEVTTGQGVDMTTLVPWVENNITTLIARKVPTTDGAPKWCQCRPQRRGRYRTGHLLRLFGPGRARTADLRHRPLRPLRPPPPHRRTTPRAHTTPTGGLRGPDPADEPHRASDPPSPTAHHRNVNSPRPASGSPSSRRATRAIGSCQPIRTTRWP